MVLESREAGMKFWGEVGVGAEEWRRRRDPTRRGILTVVFTRASATQNSSSSSAFC